jgi:hypothetical protein
MPGQGSFERALVGLGIRRDSARNIARLTKTLRRLPDGRVTLPEIARRAVGGRVRDSKIRTVLRESSHTQKIADALISAVPRGKVKQLRLACTPAIGSRRRPRAAVALESVAARQRVLVDARLAKRGRIPAVAKQLLEDYERACRAGGSRRIPLPPLAVLDTELGETRRFRKEISKIADEYAVEVSRRFVYERAARGPREQRGRSRVFEEILAWPEDGSPPPPLKLAAPEGLPGEYVCGYRRGRKRHYVIVKPLIDRRGPDAETRREERVAEILLQVSRLPRMSLAEALGIGNLAFPNEHDWRRAVRYLAADEAHRSGSLPGPRGDGP